MRDYIETSFPPKILENDSEKRISIYMPTHRTAPDNRQDAIRFKNIVSEIEETGNFKEQVKKLRELEKNQEFWLYNLDSIAVLIDEEDMAIYRLARDVEKYYEIGKRFYIKPLIRNYQSDETYHALGLARDEFKLFKGNRYGFREIKVDDEERLLENVLGDQLEGGRLNVVSHGGNVGNFHGHGAKRDEIKIDTKRFFHHVDDYIYDNFSKKERIPLILITPTEHQSLFREISDNNYLVDKGINKYYGSIKEKDLKNALWDVLQPIYNEKTADLLKKYHVGVNDDEATNNIQDTLDAILNDRVKTLVLAANKRIFGDIDTEKSSYTMNESGEDIFNHLAHLALARGSEVIILPPDKMPVGISLFSILRF